MSESMGLWSIEGKLHWIDSGEDIDSIKRCEFCREFFKKGSVFKAHESRCDYQHGGQTPCPRCHSPDIRHEAANCPCCRTWEGPTCWSVPICNECGLTGTANSDGTVWDQLVYIDGLQGRRWRPWNWKDGDD